MGNPGETAGLHLLPAAGSIRLTQRLGPPNWVSAPPVQRKLLLRVLPGGAHPRASWTGRPEAARLPLGRLMRSPARAPRPVAFFSASQTTNCCQRPISPRCRSICRVTFMGLTGPSVFCRCTTRQMLLELQRTRKGEERSAMRLWSTVQPPHNLNFYRAWCKIGCRD